MDGFRGIAALIVALYHFRWGAWGGYLAVDFFFVLSGFVIAHAYLDPRRGTFRAFVGARLARLYPLHLFSLAVYAAVLHWIGGGIPAYDGGNLCTLVQHLFLLNNVGLPPTGPSWNFPSWSISVEFWVNVVAWLLVWRMSDGARWAVVVLIYVAIGIAAQSLDVSDRSLIGPVNGGLMRGLAGFIMGLGVYRLYRSGHPLCAYCCSPVVSIVALVGIIAVLFLRNERTSVTDFLILPCVVVLILRGAAADHGIPALDTVLRWLGKISYSIYLNHIAVLVALVNLLPVAWRNNTILFAFVYVLTLLAWSSVTYRSVELPARNAFRRVLVGGRTR